MPTINENQFFTVLIEWTVDSSQQQTLMNAIANEGVDKMLNSCGFIFMANGADPAVDQYTLRRNLTQRRSE